MGSLRPWIIQIRKQLLDRYFFGATVLNTRKPETIVEVSVNDLKL